MGSEAAPALRACQTDRRAGETGNHLCCAGEEGLGTKIKTLLGSRLLFKQHIHRLTGAALSPGRGSRGPPISPPQRSSFRPVQPPWALSQPGRLGVKALVCR